MRITVIIALTQYFVIIAGQFCPPGMKQLQDGIACISDLGCDMQANGFKCHNQVCCKPQAHDEVVNYGQYCSSAMQCQYSGSQCLNNICRCAIGFTFDGQKCINTIGLGNKDAKYGQYCTSNFYCQYLNSECFNNVCLCKLDFIYDGEICSNSIGADSVPYQGHCIADVQCKPAHSECKKNICECTSGYSFDGQACSTTSKRRHFGEACNNLNQCDSDDHVLCIGNVCTCQIGYTFNSAQCILTARSALCTVPGSDIGLRDSIPIDCLYEQCAQGFFCEYSEKYRGGQYICCGEPPGIYGKVKFYTYTSKPLECDTPKSCQTFDQTPYCVFSQRYNQRVCCSTFNC